MSKLSRQILLSLGLAVGAWQGVWAADDVSMVKSIRGAEVSAPDPAPGNYRQERDHAPASREYVQQPPLIPHVIEGYTVTKNYNKCLDCHSWTRYKETGATKVSPTHFKDREGSELSNISPRRYFCMQCHVAQTDARPLVGNTFQRANGLR